MSVRGVVVMDNSDALVEALVALKPFLSKVEDNSITISSMTNRLSLTIEEVKKLSRILYEGNGQPPLTARIAALETSLILVRDAMKEEKDALSKLLTQVQAVDKTSIEVSLALEEYQLIERGKKNAAEAKSLVNYGWRLNVSQAIAILFLTSAIGFLGTEIYEVYSILKGVKGPPPTQQIK